MDPGLRQDDDLAAVPVGLLVIPAQAGIQFDFRSGLIPACATMTGSQRCWFSFASFASFALRL
jgi:hypothetical protein